MAGEYYDAAGLIAAMMGRGGLCTGLAWIDGHLGGMWRAAGVDGRELAARMERFEIEGELLEKLARAAHEAFCEGKRRDGWTFGPVRDNAKKIHPLLKDYAEIEETYKVANRATVRNIPRKLAAAGCAMAPARGGAEPIALTEEQIERMAELEHELWMEDRLAAGYVLGKETAAEPKRSPYLVAWKDLPESIREIDRDLVRAIPGILARAGYGVVRIGGGGATGSRI